MSILKIDDHQHYFNNKQKQSLAVFNKAVQHADELERIYHILAAAKARLIGEYYEIPMERIGFKDIHAVHQRTQARALEIRTLQAEVQALENQARGADQTSAELLKEIANLVSTSRTDPLYQSIKKV